MRLKSYIPREFQTEASEYGLPVGRLFEFVFVDDAAAAGSVWIKYDGQEKLVPKTLLPFASECAHKRIEDEMERRELVRQQANHMVEVLASWRLN